MAYLLIDKICFSNFAEGHLLTISAELFSVRTISFREDS